MDPLNVSAGITALLQLSSVIISYLSDVKGGPRELQRIRLEICSVLPLLSILQDQAEEANIVGSWSSTLLSLNVPKGPIQQFRTALEHLEAKPVPVQGLRKVGIIMAWRFEKEEIRGILNIIERQKSLLSLARQNDHIALSMAIKGDIDSVSIKLAEMGEGFAKMELDRELGDIQRWLSAPDLSLNYQKALKSRHGILVDWFLKSDAYSSWLSVPGSFLWIHGIPGCGKTILSSTIIQRTIKYCDIRLSAVVIYFYFDFNDAGKQTPEAMARLLLEQLLMHSHSVPSALKSLRSSCQNSKQPSNDNLLVALREIMKHFKEIFIILDALDECVDRPKLLADIGEICGWKSTNLQMLATSRLEKDLDEAISPMTNGKNRVCIQGVLADADIRQYVHDRLQTDQKLQRWKKEQQDIEMKLVEKANGMFRWATCQLDELGSCRNPAQLRKSLATLPRTLDKTYDRILCRIKEEDRQYALKILQWLTYSARPVHLKEIVEVIAIDHNEVPRFDPDRRFVDPLDVINICSSLIVVDFETDFEPELEIENIHVCSNARRNAESVKLGPILRLAHFSVKEYLISNTIHNGPAGYFGIHEPEANEILAKDCLIYLLQFNGPRELTFDIFDDYPLIKYAAKFWTEHAHNAETMGCAAIALVQELFAAGGKAFRNWIRLYNIEDRLRRVWLNRPESSMETPLYYAALVGLVQSVKMLIESGADVEAQRGRHPRTCRHKINALKAASRKGHIQIVRLLIENVADLNAPHVLYDALEEASCAGRIETVQYLLDKGADGNRLKWVQTGRALEAAVKCLKTRKSCSFSLSAAQMSILGLR